ncbi:MAG TPA: hypothetical protein VK959_03410 [Methylophilaceae bacterium]|nr:hypothetical protein [Methylophilaceae bacterium]
MVIGFFALYLLISVFVVGGVVGWAKRNNRRKWFWGGITAFLLYNLIFWDFVPTLLAHKYYCETEAGFWVYKTPEQWKSSLGGKAENLIPFGKTIEQMPLVVINPGTDSAIGVRKVNERVYKAFDIREIDNIFPIQKQTTYFADFDGKEKLAELIDFSSGYGNPMTTGGILGFKSWLSRDGCDSAVMYQEKSKYEQYLNNLIALGAEHD